VTLTLLHWLILYYAYKWNQANVDATESFRSNTDWYSLVCSHPSAHDMRDAFMSVLYTSVHLYVPSVWINGCPNHATRARRFRYTCDMRSVTLKATCGVRVSSNLILVTRCLVPIFGLCAPVAVSLFSSKNCYGTTDY